MRIRLPFFKKKPELELYVRKEINHRDLHAPDFLNTQARHLDLLIFIRNGIVPITALGHSQKFTNAYRLEKIGKEVFFHCSNQPPIKLKPETYYLFGNHGLISWDNKKRNIIPTNFMGVNLDRVAPIESVFFIDRSGVVHIKRFNKGWYDEVKMRIIVKVSECFYKSQGAALAVRNIIQKLGEFNNKASLHLAESAWPFNSKNAKFKKTMFTGIIRKIEGVYNIEINGVRQELKEGNIYIFGRSGLIELNTYINTGNNISKAMDQIPDEKKTCLSAIESIFTIKGGQIYILSY